MKEITITRALVELKRIDQRIKEKLAQQGSGFVVFKVGKGVDAKVPGSALTIDKVSAGMQSNADSIEGLIKNYQSVKRGIVKSNSETIVVVNEVNMTVADAIELKHTVDFKKAFVQRLKSERANAFRLVDQHNTKLEARVDNLLESLYGSDKGKITEEQVNSVRDLQHAKDYAEVVGLTALDARIERLEQEIEVIVTELDFILSESNAQNRISVDLTV